MDEPTWRDLVDDVERITGMTTTELQTLTTSIAKVVREYMGTKGGGVIATAIQTATDPLHERLCTIEARLGIRAKRRVVTWTSVREFHDGDLVLHQGKHFRATVTVVGVEPGDGSCWEETR